MNKKLIVLGVIVLTLVITMAVAPNKEMTAVAAPAAEKSVFDTKTANSYAKGKKAAYLSGIHMKAGTVENCEGCHSYLQNAHNKSMPCAAAPILQESPPRCSILASLLFASRSTLPQDTPISPCLRTSPHIPNMNIRCGHTMQEYRKSLTYHRYAPPAAR